MSLRFDDDNTDTHAARGLALANTVPRMAIQKQLAESLRSLKRALELDPANKIASDYYERVRNLLKQEQKSPQDSKSSSLVPKRREPPSQYNLVHKK